MRKHWFWQHRCLLAAAIALCIAGGVLLLLYSPPSGGQWQPLKVTLLKVGKADAIVLQAGEQTMVMDAGEEEDGAEVVAFLQNQGITRVDVLLITHFDRDHVGGADTVVESMDIGEVLLPDYAGTGTEYADFLHALEAKGLVPQRLNAPVEFALGDASVLVEPPLSYENSGTQEIDNNFSLITTITHGEQRLVFTGDAEKQRLRQWLSDAAPAACSFLKLPHHGIYNAALPELLDATTPQYAVICSSKKHPADAQTITLLEQQHVQVYQTKDGNVTIISDGTQLEFHQTRE